MSNPSIPAKMIMLKYFTMRYFCYTERMKVFVSGQIEDIESVRRVQAEFIVAGHEITHDWTTNEGSAKMLGSREAKLDNLEESKNRAVNDTKGVVDSDVYVICTDNEKVGKGMYVEMGVALGLCVKYGTPKIYLLGSMNHMTIFYLHPAIVHVNSVDEILRSFVSF
jgi:hypothetical protein